MKETMALTDELLVDLWLLRLLGSQVCILTCMHRTVDYNTYSKNYYKPATKPRCTCVRSLNETMALTARRRPISSQSWSSEYRRHPHRHFHCFFGRPSTFLPADTEGILSRSLPIILYKYAGGHPSPIRCFPPQHSTGGYCYWHRPRRRRWSCTSQIAGQTTSHNCARSMPPFEWSASLNEMAWIGIHTRKPVSQSVSQSV